MVKIFLADSHSYLNFQNICQLLPDQISEIYEEELHKKTQFMQCDLQEDKTD